MQANDPPTASFYSPGALLGPYKIDELIGAGGMGQVFRGVDTRLGRAVAIKVSHRQFDPRFQREARVIASLNHPNICTLHDVGPNYLVMELLDGETLAARLERGKLSIPDTLRYGSQIAGALAEAHSRGVTHRDLKPANVMLTKNGAKVLDFGLAKPQALAGEQLTQTNAVMGTPAYMSPEQIAGKPVDARSDVFSFGALLYELITGSRPFQATSLEFLFTAIRTEEPRSILQLAPDTPPELALIITNCLRKDPERRPQDMSQLKLALEALQETFRPQVHNYPKNNHRYVLAAFLGLACVLAALGLLYRSRPGAMLKPDSPRSQAASILSDPASPVPAPAGHVTDPGGNIDHESKQWIESYAQGLEDRHGSQLAVVVVDNLNGKPIEAFAAKVFDTWRIGRKNKDDGLLLVLAIKERQSRLDVGRGLEYLFTTKVCNQILSDMVPKLQKKQYGEAIRDACLTIGSLFNGGTLH